MQILKKTNLEAYKKAKELGSRKVIEILKNKALLGRGGAGFSAGMKWEMALNADADKKYIICNADEGEPGTFKDKFILMNNPELLIEGILIASQVLNAEQTYIYLRGEYEYLESELKEVIAEVLKKTQAKTKIDIVMGQGAYICGEETAIMNSIEGSRGHARMKPPYPTTKGLFGFPTVINNVETFANVSLAVHYDDWDPNLRLYSLSGNVTKPGVYELPVGINLLKLIELGEPKNKIKAVYFGCFGGCIPYGDIELTPENMRNKGCMIGTYTVIAVDEKQSIVDIAANIAKFYEFESCGKCTPCREGTLKILEMLNNISSGKAEKKDLDTIKELAEVIQETSFCGLGQTATQHLLTALKYFKEEFNAKCK